MAKIDLRSIYAFEYNDAKTVNVWDRTPLCVVLDVTREHLLCANLHWLNSKYRKKFVLYLLDRSKRFVSNPKAFAKTNYAMLKADPVLKPVLLSIRRYIRKRITAVEELDRAEIDDFMTPTRVRNKMFAKRSLSQVYRRHIKRRTA